MGHPVKCTIDSTASAVLSLPRPNPSFPASLLLPPRPGMGLKFLRDGMNSANLVAMYSVRGQGRQSTSDEIIEFVPIRVSSELSRFNLRSLNTQSFCKQDSWNFLEEDFTTHIGGAGPTEVALAFKFATVTRNIQQVINN